MDAKNPDDKNDPEVKAYIEKTTREAEDLKLESFGVEVRDNWVVLGLPAR